MGSVANNESQNINSGIDIGRLAQTKSPEQIRKESFISWLKDIFLS